MSETTRDDFPLKRKAEEKREKERQSQKPMGGHPYPHHGFEALP